MFSKNKLYIYTSFLLLLPTIWNILNRNCNYFTDYLFCSSNPIDPVKYLNFFFLVSLFSGSSFLYYRIVVSRHSRKSGNLVWKYVLLIAFIFFLIPPFGSTDIFYYRGVAQGEIEQKINPYFGGFSKNIEFLNLKYENLSPVMYPPMYLQLNKFIYSLSPYNELLSVYIYKFFSLGVFLLIAYLIKKYFGKEKMILFALNPLFLFEFVTNAHLDIYMIFFFVLSIIFITKKNFYLSYILIFLATLIKFNAVLILPFFALYGIFVSNNLKTFLTRFAEILLGVVSGFGLIALFYIPYWRGFETLQGISKQSDWSFNTLTERLTFTALNPTYHIFRSLNGESFVFIWLFMVLIGVCIFLLHFVLYTKYHIQNTKYSNLVGLILKSKIINLESTLFYSGFLLFLFPTFMVRSFLPWYLTWSSIFFIFSEFKNKEKILFLLTLILPIYYPIVYLIGHFNYFQGQVIYYNSLITIEWALFVLVIYFLFKTKIRCLKKPSKE